MKRNYLNLLKCSVILLQFGIITSCNTNNENVIKICASASPHAEILENVVKDILSEKGYTLKVTILDWTMQNDAVNNKDYDANYFQHIPYLNSYKEDNPLVASCKVHYEPLGIYSENKTSLSKGSFEICNDESNAVRAFQLLEAKNIINKDEEKENFPYTDDLKLNFTNDKWTSKDNSVSVSLVSEELLAQSLIDYDFGLLPVNSAYTGNISVSKRVAYEDDINQVSSKANVLAIRKDDYKNDTKYKNKIDVLTDALLSNEVSLFVKEKYNGIITCDETTQIDLRNKI